TRANPEPGNRASQVFFRMDSMNWAFLVASLQKIRTVFSNSEPRTHQDLRSWWRSPIRVAQTTLVNVTRVVRLMTTKVMALGSIWSGQVTQVPTSRQWAKT